MKIMRKVNLPAVDPKGSLRDESEGGGSVKKDLLERKCVFCLWGDNRALSGIL